MNLTVPTQSQGDWEVGGERVGPGLKSQLCYLLTVKSWITDSTSEHQPTASTALER